MASTTFVDETTVIEAEWANEVDALVHDVFGGAETDAEARTNLGAVGLTGNETIEGIKTFQTTGTTANVVIESTDTSATAGPVLEIRRNSASPAVSDNIGQISFTGEDSIGGTPTYASILATILDPVDGSEDGRLRLNVANAGGVSTIVDIQTGVQVGAPTGGNKGSGTLNTASTIYQNNDPVVTEASTQTISGAKTFSSTLTASGDLVVDTNTLVVDSGDNAVVLGHTEALSVLSGAARVQAHATTTVGSAISSYNWQNGSTVPTFTLGKSLGGSIGTHGVVTSGTQLGAYRFAGSDGSSWMEGIRFTGYASENWVASTANGTAVELLAIGNGSTSLSRALVAGSTVTTIPYVGIGNAFNASTAELPSAQLHVAHGSSNSVVERSEIRIQRGTSSTTLIPKLTFYKNRGNSITTPTVITSGDDLGALEVYGYAGSTGGFVQAAGIFFDNVGTVTDATTGVGARTIFKNRTTGGALTDRVEIFEGIQVGAPTGGDKGSGTINAAGDIYKNNTAYTNPDYVFEQYYTGQIVKFIDNPGAKEYKGLLPLEEVEQHTKDTFKLPGATDTPSGVFERCDFLLEKLEQAYLYIFEMEKRIKALENK